MSRWRCALADGEDYGTQRGSALGTSKCTKLDPGSRPEIMD